MTFEEIISRDGSAIFTSYEKYKVGDVIPALEHHKPGTDRLIKHPFVVVRIATAEEYIAQLQDSEPSLPVGRLRDYFYEVRTD